MSTIPQMFADIRNSVEDNHYDWLNSFFLEFERENAFPFYSDATVEKIFEDWRHSTFDELEAESYWINYHDLPATYPPPEFSARQEHLIRIYEEAGREAPVYLGWIDGCRPRVESQELLPVFPPMSYVEYNGIGDIEPDFVVLPEQISVWDANGETHYEINDQRLLPGYQPIYLVEADARTPEMPWANMRRPTADEIEAWRYSVCHPARVIPQMVGQVDAGYRSASPDPEALPPPQELFEWPEHD